jgi:hypothetical protein
VGAGVLFVADATLAGAAIFTGATRLFSLATGLTTTAFAFLESFFLGISFFLRVSFFVGVSLSAAAAFTADFFVDFAVSLAVLFVEAFVFAEAFVDDFANFFWGILLRSPYRKAPAY